MHFIDLLIHSPTRENPNQMRACNTLDAADEYSHVPATQVSPTRNKGAGHRHVFSGQIIPRVL